MAAEDLLKAGIWVVVQEKLDGWKDESVYREYVAPLDQSSSKNSVGLMRDCYELSAAIFVTDRNQMYL